MSDNLTYFIYGVFTGALLFMAAVIFFGNSKIQYHAVPGGCVYESSKRKHLIFVEHECPAGVKMAELK